jgi:hypothetical protein
LQQSKKVATSFVRTAMTDEERNWRKAFEMIGPHTSLIQLGRLREGTAIDVKGVLFHAMRTRTFGSSRERSVTNGPQGRPKSRW